MDWVCPHPPPPPAATPAPGAKAAGGARADLGPPAATRWPLLLIGLAALLVLALVLTGAGEPLGVVAAGWGVVAFLCLPLLVIIGVLGTAYVTTSRTRVLRVWGPWGASHGLRLRGGLWPWQRFPRMEGSIEGHGVRLERNMVKQDRGGDGSLHYPYTRLRLTLDRTFGHPRLIIRPHLLGDGIGRALGLGRPLGDKVFDARYVIKCKDKTLPGRLLSRPLRDLLLGVEGYTLTMRGERLEAERDGLERDPGVLDRVLRVLLVMAGRLEELAQAPGRSLSRW